MKQKEILIIAIIAILAMYILKDAIGDIAVALGLKDSPEEEKYGKDLQKLSIGAFSPNFFQTEEAVKAKCYLLTKAQSNNLCKRLYESAGFINDDEDEMAAVFKSLKTKSQISFLAYQFNLMYGKDMKAFVDDYFKGDDEHKEVIAYIAQLPKYRP